MTHLDALELRLSNERNRLHKATNKAEIELRKVWVAQIEKEIEEELKFLGKTREELPPMSADDLERELKDLL